MTPAQQQALFAEKPEEFEYALLNGDTVLYYPEGYRTVKHILFQLDDAQQARAGEIAERLAAGAVMDDATLGKMDYFVQGVSSRLPTAK